MPSYSSPVASTVSSSSFSSKARRDFALVARILHSHDEQAYAQLVHVYQKPIYQLVARMVPQRDVAEDLTLEVFMRAFRYLASFKPVFAFSTWLYRLATNHCRAFLVRRRLPVVSLHTAPAGDQDESRFAELPDGEPLPDELLAQAQRYERLHRAVKALPLKYRTLLQLHYFEEVSYDEIAAQHGLPLGTVKAQLNRGRERLKRALTREYDGLCP